MSVNPDSAYDRVEENLEDGVEKLYYRSLANFERSNFKRLNKNHMFCGRLVTGVLMLFLIAMYISFSMSNFAQKYNPITVTIT